MFHAPLWLGARCAVVTGRFSGVVEFEAGFADNLQRPITDIM
jgi:hypothetical protein